MPATVLPKALGGPEFLPEAKKAYVASAEKAGFIKNEIHPGAEGLQQFVGQKNPFASNNEVAKAYFERIANGEQLTADELFHFYQNVGEKIKPMNVKTPKGAKAINVRSVLKDELDKLSPEWAQAADAYRQASTRKAVTNILPRTDTGRPAFARLFGGATGGGVAAVLSHNPAVMLAGAATVSPALHGLAYASAGAGINILEQALKTPGVGVTILSALQHLLRENEDQGK